MVLSRNALKPSYSCRFLCAGLWKGTSSRLLKALDKDSKRAIGEDIKTLQFGWPIGMPLARKMYDNLWELRSKLNKGIARTFFTVYRNKLVLLHGFIKKSQKTSANELSLAKRRLNKLRSGQ